MKKMPNQYFLSKRDIENAFKAAAEILKNQGGTLEESPHDYQCFTFKSDGVSLVFYPHRTSARNYHIRVRDQGSKDKKKAGLIMDKLYGNPKSIHSFSRKQ